VNQFPWFTIDTTRSRTYQHQCVGPPISDVAGQTPLIQEVVSMPDQNQSLISQDEINSHTEKLSKIWSELADGKWRLSSRGRNSLRNFLRYLEPAQIYDAMIIADDKVPIDDTQDSIAYRFKYFCGICWNRINGEPAAVIEVGK
jgi:hypothetical protein